MASTYSPNLRLELIGTGDQQGTWGITTNRNLGTLVEEAIGGYTSVTVSDSGDTTLTANNGTADQSRNMVLNLTGTISAARNVLCPAVEKLYVVKNATTGGFAVTLKVSSQTGVSIPNGSTYFLYVDGTDVRLVNGTIASQNSNNVSITGGSISNAALSDVTVVANTSSLSVRDSDASHILSISVGTNLTANRVFTLTTGDAARTLDISAGNVTISTAGSNLIDDADASAQRTTLGLGTIATQNSNNVTITGGSISGITDIALADGGTGASLSDPNADAVLGWNDTAGVMRFFTAGTGISINATSNTISLTSTDPTSNTQVFNSSGTWTKPSGTFSTYNVQIWGAGGSGGCGVGGAPGGGGGGGGYISYTGPVTELGSTETVTVGAGGVAVTTTSVGNAGGSSSFTRSNVSTITVFGGGGGGGGSAVGGNGHGGGGGGSVLGVGGTPSSTSVSAGFAGGLDAGSGGFGSDSSDGQDGNSPASFGGAGGGGSSGDSTDTVGDGGNAIFGGGGGGAGAVDSNPGPGSGGTSVLGGAGGAGASDSSNATNGSQPGGGGGGSETGNSGAGGAGRVIVTVW